MYKATNSGRVYLSKPGAPRGKGGVDSLFIVLNFYSIYGTYKVTTDDKHNYTLTKWSENGEKLQEIYIIQHTCVSVYRVMFHNFITQEYNYTSTRSIIDVTEYIAQTERRQEIAVKAAKEGKDGKKYDKETRDGLSGIKKPCVINGVKIKNAQQRYEDVFGVPDDEKQGNQAKAEDGAYSPEEIEKRKKRLAEDDAASFRANGRRW